MTSVKIAVRSALLCGALVATAAHAVTPSAVSSTNRLYISGATATDNALATLFLRSGTVSAPAFCKANTIDVYINNTDLASAKQRSILCTLNTAVGSLAANTNVAVSKESNGGSDQGTVTIANADTRTYVNLTNDTSPSCGTAVPVAANTLPSFPGHQAFTLHPSCAGTATVHPDVGIADVNPALFTAGVSPVTPAQIGRLTSDALYQPVFAVGVSTNLYRALQRAQGKTVGSDTAANVPSLSYHQMASIYTGAIADWSQVLSSTGTPINSTTYTNGVSVSGTVYVCRRGDESGTQASHASHFLRERCESGVLGFASATNSSCQQSGCQWNASFAGDAVFAGSGAGEVRKCLDAHNDLDQFAVGVLSNESVYDGPGSLGGSANAAAGTQQFRYVALDGHVPNLESVANGQYNFVEENVLNRRNVVFNGQPVISGPQVALADYVKNSFANPDVIATLIVPQTHGLTGGLAGALSGTPNPPPVSAATLQTNPVSALTKSALGVVNDCAPAILPGTAGTF